MKKTDHPKEIPNELEVQQEDEVEALELGVPDVDVLKVQEKGVPVVQGRRITEFCLL